MPCLPVQSCWFYHARRIPQSGVLYLQARLDPRGLGFETCHRRTYVVTDLYLRLSIRIPRFADFARVYFSLTHVQWF